MKQQICYCNATNRRSATPVTLYVTSIGEKMRSLLTKANAYSWVSFHIHDEEYIQLPIFNNKNNNNIKDNNKVKKLVYLTSDADDTLETLEDDAAYIIGGIVDRNRLKGVTYNKARLQGIATAKLPIKENYTLSSTHVLTVNHVFAILLQFRHTNCWKTAIENIMPTRKGKKGNNGEDNNDEDNNNEDNNDEDNNDEDSEIASINNNNNNSNENDNNNDNSFDDILK